MLDATELAEWYPRAEGEKLAKAALLADVLPQLLGLLEGAVLDTVLEDAALELTRIGILREIERATTHDVGEQPQKMHSGGCGSALPVPGGTPSVAVGGKVEGFAAYVQQCSSFEDELRRKYG
mmetsp:Transcript_55890/g.181458  ORF Transcript_55890/g.181458 Transcript_55890/m.181458 type:complete len:123 (-) Transcript_55890:202-570(-)